MNSNTSLAGKLCGAMVLSFRRTKGVRKMRSQLTANSRQIIRFLLLLAVSCGLSAPASAQFTIVTGTVKDVNGVAYAGGTISASLVLPGNCTATINGVSFTGSMSPIGLDSTGSFTARLGDNNVINCGGTGTTQWKFLVNNTGAPPPLGTGPQTCTATLTITGASQSVSASFAACPALGNSSGGISSGPVLPATCTPGVTANVQGSATIVIGAVSYPAGTEFRCVATNIWAPVSMSVVDAAAYGVQTGIIATDCTFTSGQPTVVCTTTVPTTAMIGWIIKATNGCCGRTNHINGVHEFPAATVTAINAGTKTFTLSQNALANVSPGATLGSIFGAGPDSSSTLSTAWTAATSGVNCQTLQLPSGPVFSKSGQFNTSGNCKLPLSGSISPDIQGSIFGWGAYTSLIVLAEGFDFTTGVGNSCGGTASSVVPVCFGGIQALRAQNWGVTGLSDSTMGGSTNLNLFAMGNDSEFWNMACLGVGANNSHVFGLEYDNGAQALLSTQLDGCGAFSLNIVDTAPGIISDSFAGDSAQAAVNFNNNVFLSTNNNGFATNSVTTNGVVSVAGTGVIWNSSGDNIDAPAGGISVNVLGSGSFVKLSEDLVGSGATGINIATGARVAAIMTKISGSTSAVACAGTALFLNSPTNTLAGGSVSTCQPTVSISGNGTIALGASSNSLNESGFLTLTAGTTTGATPTVTLTFAGTFSGPTGQPPSCELTLLEGTVNGVTYTGTWTTPAVVKKTAGTTALQTWTILNGGATALTATSTYGLEYLCQPR
jgi:hypothetical protein